MAEIEHEEVVFKLAIDVYNENGEWRARLAGGPELALDVSGCSRDEALLKVKAMALRAIAEQAEENIDPTPSVFHLHGQPAERALARASDSANTAAFTYPTNRRGHE